MQNWVEWMHTAHIVAPDVTCKGVRGVISVVMPMRWKKVTTKDTKSAKIEEGSTDSASVALCVRPLLFMHIASSNRWRCV